MAFSAQGQVYNLQKVDPWEHVDSILPAGVETTYYLGPYQTDLQVKLTPNPDGVGLHFEVGSGVKVAEDEEHRTTIFSAEDMGNLHVSFSLDGRRK